MAGPRTLLVPALFAAAGFAILVGLGIWQVERLGWKEGLIARVEGRLEAAPVAAPPPAAWPSLDVAAAEYTPVTATGRYRNADEVHVVYALTDPHGPASGLGYLVMTPLETADGWLVFVNRGFVPRDRKAPATRAEGQVEGTTTVTGLLRQPATRSWFMPADGVAANEWFSRDPQLYAKALGLPADRVAPYIIDARFDPALAGGLPQGGETVVSFTNNHLQYAVTWFGLAAALAAVFGVLVWGRGKERQ